MGLSRSEDSICYTEQTFFLYAYTLGSQLFSIHIVEGVDGGGDRIRMRVHRQICERQQGFMRAHRDRIPSTFKQPYIVHIVAESNIRIGFFARRRAKRLRKSRNFMHSPGCQVNTRGGILVLSHMQV